MKTNQIEITIQDWDELESHERYTDYNEEGNLTFYKIEQSEQEELTQDD